MKENRKKTVERQVDEKWCEKVREIIEEKGGVKIERESGTEKRERRWRK